LEDLSIALEAIDNPENAVEASETTSSSPSCASVELPVNIIQKKA
jgi:hypothetical protein